MFGTVYRQIARFLNWVNRTGSSGTSRAIRDAENHRRGVESQYGGYAGRDSSYGDWGDGGD